MNYICTVTYILFQGSLTEGEGLVQLTTLWLTSLYQLNL
jgi:hypothetical protein